VNEYELIGVKLSKDEVEPLPTAQKSVPEFFAFALSTTSIDESINSLTQEIALSEFKIAHE
jgi:hypothetical protein